MIALLSVVQSTIAEILINRSEFELGVTEK